MSIQLFMCLDCYTSAFAWDAFRGVIVIIGYFQFCLLHRNLVILWDDFSHSNDPVFYLLGYQHWCTFKVDSSSLPIVFFFFNTFFLKFVSYTNSIVYLIHKTSVPWLAILLPFFLDFFLQFLFLLFCQVMCYVYYVEWGFWSSYFIQIPEYLSLPRFIFQWDK